MSTALVFTTAPRRPRIPSALALLSPVALILLGHAVARVATAIALFVASHPPMWGVSRADTDLDTLKGRPPAPAGVDVMGGRDERRRDAGRRGGIREPAVRPRP